MPQFAYHSVDKDGRVSDGTMVADSEESLEQRLREIGYWLIDARMQTAKKKMGRGKVPRRELMDFFNGSTTLLIAGIPIADTITGMAEETTHEALKAVLEDVSLNIRAGNEVSVSMRSYPQVFSEQICNLVKAGESGGNLEVVFQDIANHLEWVDRIMGDIKQASIYPAMILAAVGGLVALMFTVVVPRFAEIFVQMKIPLPALTQAIVDIGMFSSQYWWLILLALVAAVVGLRNARRVHKTVAFKIDDFKLRMPIFGELQRLLAQSQFVHNLALMLKAGVPILEALKLSRGLVDNLVMDKAINDALAAVEQGGKISDAFREHAVISSLTLRMIVVGEDAGRLDTTLQQVSDRFDEEIPRRIKKVFSVMEPLITLTLVGVVGLVAASLFLPMFSLVSGLGR
ncbi:MAG: type II secretion system F family protein [Pseudomonadota bacterium]